MNTFYVCVYVLIRVCLYMLVYMCVWECVCGSTVLSFECAYLYLCMYVLHACMCVSNVCVRVYVALTVRTRARVAEDSKEAAVQAVIDELVTEQGAKAAAVAECHRLSEGLRASLARETAIDTDRASLRESLMWGLLRCVLCVVCGRAVWPCMCCMCVIVCVSVVCCVCGRAVWPCMWGCMCCECAVNVL